MPSHSPRRGGSRPGWSAKSVSTKPKPATLRSIVTELATNLLKHAKRGEILLRPLDRGNDARRRIYRARSGAGHRESHAMFSRRLFDAPAAPATGLGAIARLAGEFDIHSMPGKGTAVLARLWPRMPYRSEIISRHRVRHCQSTEAGEEVCGDGWKCEVLGRQKLVPGRRRFRAWLPMRR